MWAILPIREWRCQDIDQVLLHEISEVLGKNASIRSNLPNAACWSRKKGEEDVKPTCFDYVESDFGATDRQIVHNILRPLRR